MERTSATPQTHLRLHLRQITKRYSDLVANDCVDLDVQAGEIHAVLGENGAGKSTLMKIIYGAVKPDSGSMYFDGKPCQVRNPNEARALGISMVFQHFSLFETLSVAENVCLGLGKEYRLSQVIAGIQEKSQAYGLEIDPTRPVHTLSVGEMQRVEIVRALMTDPKLLILDEPTSVLTPQAVENLFLVLRKIAKDGCSILYISHKLHEIQALCSACTVLRAGRVTGSCDPRQESTASLSRLMIGSELPQIQHSQQQLGPVVLQVQNLSLPAPDPFATSLEDIDLQVQAGEVVGIAGVSGNGQKELLQALSGEYQTASSGGVSWTSDQGQVQDLSQLGPIQRRQLGLHFVPEERLGRGAVPSMGLADNLLLTRTETLKAMGWIDKKRLLEQARKIIADFKVKASGPDALAQSLSGGNLQKFIVGREVDAKPRLLILSQPTWGVDVGAMALIHEQVLALRDAGCAVLVISEELDELFALSDRLYVIAKGRLSPSIARSEATLEQVGEWMSGLWGNPNSGENSTATASNSTLGSRSTA